MSTKDQLSIIIALDYAVKCMEKNASFIGWIHASATGDHLEFRSDPLVVVELEQLLVVEPGVPSQRRLHRLVLLRLLVDDGDEPAQRRPHLGAIRYLVVGAAVEAEERQEGLALPLAAAGLAVLLEREQHRRRLQERRPRRPRELLRWRRRLLPALGRERRQRCAAVDGRRRGGARGGGGEGEGARRERRRADEGRAGGRHHGARPHRRRRGGGQVPRLEGVVVRHGDGEPRRGGADADALRPGRQQGRRRLEPQRRRPRVRRERRVLQRVLEVQRAHHRRRRRQLHERPHSLDNTAPVFSVHLPLAIAIAMNTKSNVTYTFQRTEKRDGGSMTKARWRRPG